MALHICSKRVTLQAVFLYTTLSTLLLFLYVVLQVNQVDPFHNKKATQFFITDGSTHRERDGLIEVIAEWDPPAFSSSANIIAPTIGKEKGGSVKMKGERKPVNTNATNFIILPDSQIPPIKDTEELFVKTEVQREFLNLNLRGEKRRAATVENTQNPGGGGGRSEPTSQSGNASNVASQQQHGVGEAVPKKQHSWNFSLPWHNGVSVDHYRDTDWFSSLLRYSQQTVDRSEPVVMVCSDNTFLEGLVNWLIWTFVLQDTPPKNVIVVTNRNKVCSLIVGHGIPAYCLKMSVNYILNKEGVDQVKGHQFSHLLAVRMSAMRILNHLGHHVMNLDTDAIMLKNPIPVLERNGDSDVVGTYGGSLPSRLSRKWGIVACMGAVMIRSTPATELMWEEMNNIERIVDDQVLFNTALETANIQWRAVKAQNVTPKHDSLSNVDTSWIGHTPKGLKVTLLPQRIMCRRANCQMAIRNEVYVWHHGKTRHKIATMSEQAAEDGVWRLKKDWSRSGSAGKKTGLEWLASMSQQH